MAIKLCVNMAAPYNLHAAFVRTSKVYQCVSFLTGRYPGH